MRGASIPPWIVAITTRKFTVARCPVKKEHQYNPPSNAPEYLTTSSVFQMSTREINHAAIVKAAGYLVEVVRQAGSRRAVFYFPDCPHTRELLEKFDRREVIPLPAKSILNARTELYFEASRIVREAL